MSFSHKKTKNHKKKFFFYKHDYYLLFHLLTLKNVEKQAVFFNNQNFQTTNYLAILKKLLVWYIIPCENVEINFYGLNYQMQFNCVVIVSYNLGSLMIKIPCLVFLLKHEISKQKFFVFAFYEKMLIIQFHLWKNCLFCYFHTLSFAL